jgi:hypothetical protein
MDNSLTTRAADNIRILSAAMVEKAKSGHPGGAMGGADFINILYDEFLNIDPSDPNWHFRDRFFLDPGHMSPMIYSILTLLGLYSLEDLKSFRQWGSNGVAIHQDILNWMLRTVLKIPPDLLGLVTLWLLDLLLLKGFLQTGLESGLPIKHTPSSPTVEFRKRSRKEQEE